MRRRHHPAHWFVMLGVLLSSAACGSNETEAPGSACDKGVPDICNGIDDNCNGEIDEGDPGGGADCSTGLEGVCAKGTDTCVDGAIVCKADVGDIKADTVADVCNDLDDDCDGQTDEDGPFDTFYKDDDGDGVGGDVTIEACKAPPGYVDDGGDCNELNPNIHPGAVEVCNDADDNCNGYSDEGVQKPIFYKDNDGDAFGGVTSTFACQAPAGFVTEGGDCNDFNVDIGPGAPEACDDLDNDCNGLVDDGVPTQTIYKDNDGDGVAPLGALSQAKCNVPIGWTKATDVDGDGALDWDCNDSDFTVHPGAPTICDGKDNDCDGVIDRLCFSACGGSWPYHPVGAQESITYLSEVDLDGDGYHEVIFQTSQGLAILDHDGKSLYAVQTNDLNFSRGRSIVADLDTYDKYGPFVQTLDILTANASVPTYYFLKPDNSVTVLTSSLESYDASVFLASDLDRDGVVEFFTSSWCHPDRGTRIFRYDRPTGTIKLAKDIADPDGTCEYGDGRVLTDLDGDGDAEYIFGNGYASGLTPSTWKGRIHTSKFTNRATLANAPFCDPAACFSTAIPNLIPGGVFEMYRFGGELRAKARYFDEFVVDSSSTSYFWSFGPNGSPLAGSPSLASTLFNGTTDVDDDGTPEDLAGMARMGLYDVNGDGYPDQLTSLGNELHVDLWNPTTKSFVTNAGSTKSIAATNVAVWAAWDMDSDGRLEVLSSDANMNVYCHELGSKTWDKSHILPPHLPLYLRTNQWDNYEPNEGKDTNGDGVPDQVIRVPSALTTKGDFYSYLSSPTDKDFFLIDAGYTGPICMTSPKGRSYTLRVYSFEDRKPPAGPDGLVWEDTSAAPTKCFSTGSVIPVRNGEYRFVVGIESQGTYSAAWPYWITAPK